METLAIPMFGPMGAAERKFYLSVPSLREFAV